METAHGAIKLYSTGMERLEKTITTVWWPRTAIGKFPFFRIIFIFIFILFLFFLSFFFFLITNKIQIKVKVK